MSTFKPRGIIIPMVTPFRGDGSLDEMALRRLTQRLLEAGVDGLFPAGSSGEFFSLSEAERLRVIQIVVEEAAGRVRVYAGTGAIATQEAIRCTQEAEALGADAAVLITPFYITPTQDELYAHYAAVAASTTLPIIPYNNPGRTGGVNLEPNTVVRLAQLPNLAGIKDSAGNLSQFAEYLRLVPTDFSVMQGRDDLFYESFQLGAAGAVSAIGNVCPELVVTIYRSHLAGDTAQAQAAQDKVSMLRRALSMATFPAVLKAAMDLVGQPVGASRRPVAPLSGLLLKDLGGILEQMNLAVTA